MRRRRDQADVALGLPVGSVVCADREQPGELALTAGVRLQRHRVVAGDLDQPGFEFSDELETALHLVQRRERVLVGELGKGHRLHLGGRVQLHRARPERDHAAVQRVVAVAQSPHVAQHRGLAAVGVEDRVSQVCALAQERRRQGIRRAAVEVGEVNSIGGSERGPDPGQVFGPGDLVGADADGVRVHPAQVDPLRARRGDDVVGPAGHRDVHGVEEVVVHRREAVVAQPLRDDRGHPVGALGDGPQAVRPVVDRIHARDDREQDLRRADVAGRLLTADVLLAGLQREPVCRRAVGVDADADESAGHRALQARPDRDVAGVRPAEPERDPEPLAGAHRDVGAKLTR